MRRGTDFPEIIFEDNHLIAVNKPSGILVQGDKTGDKPLVELIKEYIKKKYVKPGAVFLGVVHRLDRPVSGLVVFARTSKSLSRMNELFRSRKMEKIYWGVTEKSPGVKEGVLTHWLSKDEEKNKTTVYRHETEGALKSELSYRIMHVGNDRCLLEVKPLTGRSHQIRAQLAAMGCPIIGDTKYGSSIQSHDGSIALHARSLQFVHPVKKEPVTLTANVPSTEEWLRWHL